MAASTTTPGYEDEEDVDVVWEGSPLHEHLKAFGIEEVTESRHLAKPVKRRLKRPSGQQSLAHHVQWPRGCSSALEIEVAKKIMESELLVQEDQDFLSNFILTDEAFADYEKKLQDKSHGGSSLLSDVIFFTGSVAAVAGTILYLSERTRLATTMAAVLPTALAAFSSARSPKTGQPEKEKEEFLRLVDLLLNDMKVFKQMVRKSLNLLHGMELMNSGYLFAINRSTGTACTSASKDLRQISQLSEASFPALRLATYQCTIQLLETYREALGKLMQVSPLAEYIDMKEHYIAFVDLECFGIEKSASLSSEGDSITVKSLKDAVQLALVQQSEYLRRFSLVFCDRVRDENGLNQTEIIGQVREVAATIRRINVKLTGVFEYHQALGINSKQKMLNIKKKQLQFNFVPLRSLYTSLFSTGLHLQNSLLRVRKMETIFDAMEKSRRPESGPMFPSETQIVEWLRGFQDVQRELNACVGCLEEGVSQINVLKGDEDSLKDDDVSPADDSLATDDESQKEVAKIQESGDETEIDDENFDQVFEAFVTCERSHSQLDDDEDDDRFSNPCASKLSSNKLLMSELKQVLVGKAEEHRCREEKAIERKNMKPKTKSSCYPSSNENSNENGHSSTSLHSEHSLEKDRNDLHAQVTSSIDPEIKSSNLDKKQTHIANSNGDFEHFFDLQNVAPVSTKIDPFCPNGTSYRSCQNGFDDDFLSQSNKESENSNVTQERDDTSDDDDDGMSSSSSHASTIKSVRGLSMAEKTASKKKSGSSSTNSDDSDSHLDPRPSFSKVSHRKYTRRKIHFNGKVSDKNGVHEVNHQVQTNPVTSDTVSVAEIRSVSTPDLKQLAVLSSPYISLEDVNTTPSKAWTKSIERESSDDSNSSDRGSMDELENYTLKTFKRPLRPVALRKSQLRSRKSIEDPRQEPVKEPEKSLPTLEEIQQRVLNQGQTSDSVYRRRHQGEINEVRQPSGFESFLASQVVAKAQQFSKKFNFKPKEEIFGSDSD